MKADARWARPAAGSGFDLYRVPEVDGVEDGAILVFDVDAVSADEMPGLLDRLGRGEPHLSMGELASRFEVVEVQALGIGRVDIVMEVEEIEGHDAATLPGRVRSTA